INITHKEHPFTGYIPSGPCPFRRVYPENREACPARGRCQGYSHADFWLILSLTGVRHLFAERLSPDGKNERIKKTREEGAEPGRNATKVSRSGEKKSFSA